MSQFFRSLVALGEEDDNEETSTTKVVDDDELAKLSQKQLVELVKKYQERMQAKNQQYDDLRTESVTLRSDYDAFKRKADQWQVQMKEARDADRKLIEDLRAASSTGENSDELLVKSMNETIAKYKEQLRAANDDMAKAFRRQKEAEESRRLVEESKKRELEELSSKFEAFRERMKSQQSSSPEAERKAAKSDASLVLKVKSLQERLSQADQRRVVAESRERTATQEVQELRAQLEAAHQGARSADGTTDGAEEAGEQRGGASPVPAADTKALREAQAQVDTLREEVRSLAQRLDNAATQHEEALSKKQDEIDRLEQQLQDNQWDTMEAEKKLSEARSQLESALMQSSTNESAMEEKEQELQASKRQWMLRIRTLEETVESEKEHRANSAKEYEQQITTLKTALSEAHSKAGRSDELQSEIDASIQRTQDALEVQKKHYESVQRGLERRLQELEARRVATEEALQDAKDDIRRRADVAEELRLELDESSQRLAELENSLTLNQRSVNAREEDVLLWEREKQQLRQSLQNERESADKLRTANREDNLRITELQEQLLAAKQRQHELQCDKDKLLGEVALLNRQIVDTNDVESAKEKVVREIQVRYEQEVNTSAELTRVRDMQAAKVRQLEGRVRDLEMDLQQSQRAGSGGEAMSSRGSSSYVDLPPPIVTKKDMSAVLSSAFASSGNAASSLGSSAQSILGKLTMNQTRSMMFAAVLLLLFLGMMNSFFTSGQHKAANDAESINVLREKYGQTLTAASLCRESLASAKEQLLAKCPPCK